MQLGRVVSPRFLDDLLKAVVFYGRAFRKADDGWDADDRSKRYDRLNGLQMLTFETRCPREDRWSLDLAGQNSVQTF